MPAAENRALLERFYESFARGDAAGMNASYAPDVAFSDPMFGPLRGGLIDFSLSFEVGAVDDTSGHVHWVANDTYSATKRRVRNDVNGTFAFANGLIGTHDDVFDHWKWSSQALGPSGTLLGWTPFVSRVRSDG